MTPREGAAVTLLWLLIVAVLIGVSATVAMDKIRNGHRLFGCRRPGCITCGGSWRDSEVQR